MLHVFDVCGGQMQALDMGLLTQYVAALQSDLASKTRVAVRDQVLLVSGGEVLEGDRPVSDYKAGTDSNPIFLVSKCETPAINDGPENLKYEWSSLRDQVQQLVKVPASYEIVKRLATLAKQASPLADDGLALCTRLVHEQHLLHQGWNALVAHLDDTAKQFCRRAKRFKENREHFIQRIDSANDLLKDFPEDLALLDSIPLCEPILSAEDLKKLCTNKENDGKASLLDWICASDPQSSIHELATVAQNLLHHLLDENSLAPIMKAECVESSVSNDAMKEIKGIGNRLRQLDDGLMKAEEAFSYSTKQSQNAIDCEQNALTESREQTNLEKIRETQSNHLNELFAGLEKLLQIASKFADSKIELLENVRHRISNWIKTTHHDIYTGSTQLYVHGERLSSLKKRLELIRQMHEASTIYAQSVSEVLRRQRFSKEFNAWATCLVEQMQKLNKEETESRNRYKEKLQKHFLKSLFVGMSDNIPDFANRMPVPFDEKMPPLTAESLRQLRDSLPKLAPFLQVSQPRIFEKLSVHDQNWSSSLRREASFFTHTPPKMALGARSIPSFAWMSGEENLEMSTSPSPSSRMGFVALGLGSHQPSPDQQNNQEVEAESEREPEREPEREREPITSARSSEPCSGRSAPIRIPSRAPSDGMSVSRQMSEKSSRFGTPEQDLPCGDPASLEDMATSPPEFVSGSALKYEIGQMTSDLVDKVESWNSNSATNSTNTNDSIRPLDQRDKRRLEDLVLQLGRIREEFNEAKQFIRGVSGSGIHIPEQFCGKLEMWMEEKEKSVVEREMEPANKEIKELRMKVEEERRVNLNKLDIEGHKIVDQEQQINVLHQWILEKEESLSSLKEERESVERVWAAKVNEAQAEMMKQLTISHELEMDDLRNEHRQILQNRENEIDELKCRVVEKEATVRQMQMEQDKLVAVVCENRGSPVGSPMSSIPSSFMASSQLETSINVQKQTRFEVEREFKSKLHLLTQGLLDDKKRIKDRFLKEKEYELRMAQEASDTQMNKMRKDYESQIEALKTSLSTGHTCDTLSIMTQSVPCVTDVVLESSAMTASAMPMSESVMHLPQTGKEDPSLVCSSTATTKQTQTRLRLKDMRSLINICEVREGDTVLVVWNEEHKAYAVYTSSNMLYFVKKGFSTGLTTAADDPTSVRKLCAVVRIVKLEYCQITKADNRYKLAINTKFCRVEVDKLDVEPMPKLEAPIKKDN